MYKIEKVFQKAVVAELEQINDYWVGAIYELPPSRIGACSVLFSYSFPSRGAAVAGILRKWRELFPRATPPILF